MKHEPRPTILGALGALGLLALGAPAALAQEQEEPERPPIEDLNPFREQGGSDPMREMIELFREVERDLERIDMHLLEASSGDTARLQEVELSRLDELLDSAPPTGAASGMSARLSASRLRGERVLERIDKILEIAQQQSQQQQQQQGQGQGQGQGEGQSQPGQSPLDGQEGNRTEREQGRRAPGEGEQGTGQGQPGDGDPRGNQEAQGRGENQPDSEMPGHETAAPPAIGDESERWGDLPIYYRDLFRAEGGRDMPAQYRSWIDAYYRRLNERADK